MLRARTTRVLLCARKLSLLFGIAFLALILMVQDEFGGDTWAALIAASFTGLYIRGKARLNGEGALKMSSYMKPSILNALLVYSITSTRVGKLDLNPHSLLSANGLNATVTLLKSSISYNDLRDVIHRIYDVKHLAQHLCLLIEDPDHLAWLERGLEKTLPTQLRERVRLIDLSGEFTRCIAEPRASEICHETKVSKLFSTGYRHMCRIWYSALWQHMKDYDFILRFDIDNKIIIGTWPTNIRHFGTVKCVRDDNPLVTVGLSKTIWGNLKEHSEKIYPYTNVMFVNVRWATTNADLLDIFQRVEDSNCVCINRWGDLPLWGETLSRLGELPEVMPGWKYAHKSHGSTIVESDTSSCM